MARTVHCRVLGHTATGLDAPPLPGELGQRIFEPVSMNAWQQWLVRQRVIINREGLVSSEPAAYARVTEHVLGYFIGEGDLGELPGGFRPRQPR